MQLTYLNRETPSPTNPDEAVLDRVSNAHTGRYIAFYNARRPHTALDGRAPDQAYFDPLPLRTAA